MVSAPQHCPVAYFLIRYINELRLFLKRFFETVIYKKSYQPLWSYYSSCVAPHSRWGKTSFLAFSYWCSLAPEKFSSVLARSWPFLLYLFYFDLFHFHLNHPILLRCLQLIFCSFWSVQGVNILVRKLNTPSSFEKCFFLLYRLQYPWLLQLLILYR